MVVNVSAQYQPLLPLVGLPPFTISSDTGRTIVKDVDIEGWPAGLPTNTPNYALTEQVLTATASFVAPTLTAESWSWTETAAVEEVTQTAAASETSYAATETAVVDEVTQTAVASETSYAATETALAPTTRPTPTATETPETPEPKRIPDGTPTPRSPLPVLPRRPPRGGPLPQLDLFTHRGEDPSGRLSTAKAAIPIPCRA